jgi:23S rRNA (adenine1618-N6)-methyltransferase
MKLAGDKNAVKLKEIPDKVALGVRVYLRLTQGDKPEEQKVQTLVRWAQGTDTVLFESFCGMVKRKMEAR